MELKLKMGVDNLKFGMTINEVIRVLNEPNRILNNEDNENEVILEWNYEKLRLTFLKNENDRFAYLRTINPELKFNGKRIIGGEVEYVKKGILGELISDWEMDDYGFFITHFNEAYWLTLHEKYGIVTDFELGLPFENDEDYNWPD